MAEKKTGKRTEKKTAKKAEKKAEVKVTEKKAKAEVEEVKETKETRKAADKLEAVAAKWFDEHGAKLLAHDHTVQTIAYRAAYTAFGRVIPNHVGVAGIAIRDALNDLGMRNIPDRKDLEATKEFVVRVYVNAVNLSKGL